MSVRSFDQLSYRSDVSDQLSHRSFASQIKETTEANKGPHLTGNLKLLDTIECPAVVMCCRFSPDGSHLAVGLNDGSIKIYGNNSQMLYSLSDEDTTREQQAVTHIRFLPNVVGEHSYEHRLMATYASALVKFWHYTSGKCLHTINEARKSTLALDVSPDNSRFLTAGYTDSDSNQIHLYDMETRMKLNTMEPSESKDKMDGHTGRVFAMQYHPTNNHIFISGGWDDTVQYWDDRDQHSIKKFPGPHICGDALDIDPVHNHILTGSWRKHDVLQIWDFAMAVKIKDVPQDSYNNSQLYCAQWLGKDSIVCGGNDRNMACVIDRGTLNTTGMLVDLPQGVYCIDNDRNTPQPRIAIGADRSVYRVVSSKYN